MPTIVVYVGADVAKATFVVSLLTEELTYPNTAAGHAEFCAVLKERPEPTQVVCEDWRCMRPCHRPPRPLHAALSASQHNRILRAYYASLLARGKPALTAVMRKLIVLLTRLLADSSFVLADRHRCSGRRREGEVEKHHGRRES